MASKLALLPLPGCEGVCVCVHTCMHACMPVLVCIYTHIPDSSALLLLPKIQCSSQHSPHSGSCHLHWVTLAAWQPFSMSRTCPCWDCPGVCNPSITDSSSLVVVQVGAKGPSVCPRRSLRGRLAYDDDGRLYLGTTRIPWGLRNIARVLLV